MSDIHIDYYFAVASPWSYMGHRRLGDLAERYGATIALKPCDAGQVFPVSGGLPLAKRAPQRQAYRLVELQRWSRHLGIPLNLHPKHFPVDEALAAQMIIAADRRGEDAFGLTLALMEGVWAEEQDIAQPDDLREIALTCGLDAEALLTAAETPEMAAERQSYTAEAIGRQVFGWPTYMIDGEPFWGQDRLDFVERKLANMAAA